MTTEAFQKATELTQRINDNNNRIANLKEAVEKTRKREYVSISISGLHVYDLVVKADSIKVILEKEISCLTERIEKNKRQIEAL